jgi:limonene-1,2-epoxide hydrolase
VTPEEVARRYFATMRNGESVEALFAPDAVIRGFGNHVRGRDAIVEIYERTQAGDAPKPDPIAIAADGNRALAELRATLRDGTVLHVVDVFEVRGDLITSLTYFRCDDPGG